VYLLTVATLVLIYVILALSLNLITGVAGQVSLGHAAFFGVGAYTLGYLMKTLGVPFAIALPLCLVTAGLLGLVLGGVSLRLREDFLAIATIGVNFVVAGFFLYMPYFGGPFGITGIARPLPAEWYFGLVLLVTIAVALLHERIRRSDLGLALLALKESEDAAAALAVDVRRFKITAFTIGCALAGLAGGLYASYISVITPNDFSFPLSVTILAMVSVGGMGTLWGPVLGALVLGAFAQAFAFVAYYQLFLYGLLLALVMRYRPQGLLGRRA